MGKTMTDQQLMHDTRIQLHLTQPEMANKLGYSHRETISAIENGNRGLSNVARQFLFYIRDNEL
jgi:DNA-binding XRE family transcriptional regulator